MLSEKSALLTYKVIQDGTYVMEQSNSKIQGCCKLHFQNDKWLEAFYMESKIE